MSTDSSSSSFRADSTWSVHSVLPYPVSSVLLHQWYKKGRSDKYLVECLYNAYQYNLEQNISFKQCALYYQTAEEFLLERKTIKALDRDCEALKVNTLCDLITSLTLYYLRLWNQEHTKGHAIHPCDGSIQKHPYHKDLDQGKVDITSTRTSCAWSNILIAVNDRIRKPVKQKRARDEEEEEEEKKDPVPVPVGTTNDPAPSPKKHKPDITEEPPVVAATPPPPHPPTPTPPPPLLRPLEISISTSSSWEEDEEPTEKGSHRSNDLPTPVTTWSAQQCFQQASQLTPSTPSRTLSVVSRSNSLVPKALSHDFASFASNTSPSSSIVVTSVPTPVPNSAPSAPESDERVDLDHYVSKVLISYDREAFDRVPPDCTRKFRLLMDCRDIDKLLSVWNLLTERADPCYRPHSYFPWYKLKEQYQSDLEWMQEAKKQNSNAMWTHIASNIKLFFDGLIDPVHQQSLTDMMNEQPLAASAP